MAKAASLFIYENAISSTFSTLVNWKHQSTLASITTRKISKVPIQYQLEEFQQVRS